MYHCDSCFSEQAGYTLQLCKMAEEKGYSERECIQLARKPCIDYIKKLNVNCAAIKRWSLV
jgi:hypothetical protein